MNDIGAIAARVGVTPGSMAAVKTPFMMGTYNREGAMIGEQIESGANLKFGLERDLQSAEEYKTPRKGLRIIDGGKEKCMDGLRLTAEDSETKVVIIELEAGAARKESVSQLLTYLGAQKKSGDPKLARSNNLAESFDQQTKLAASMVRRFN